MKPFATLGSEISKVRERVRRGAESLRPAKVASDVRDQRDRLLAKLGEQTFRLIAERKLQVPKVLQESVERLATLLGVQLPPQSIASEHSSVEVSEASRLQGASTLASDPLHEPAEVDEPSLGDTSEAAPFRETPAPETPARIHEKPASRPKKNGGSKKGAAKKRAKR